MKRITLFFYLWKYLILITSCFVFAAYIPKSISIKPIKKYLIHFSSEQKISNKACMYGHLKFSQQSLYVYSKLSFPNSCLQSSSSLVKLSWFLSVFIFRIRNAMKKNKDDAIAKDDAASESFHPRRFSRWTFTKGRASSNTRTSSSTEM